MRILEMRLGGNALWPTLEWKSGNRGLDALYGPALSGKTALAEFLAHVLFGQQPAAGGPAAAGATLEGDVIVESGGRRFRLRRAQDSSAALRLTVAALDSSPVDHRTIRALTHELPPNVLGPLCAVAFRESPRAERLLSDEFARGFQSILRGGHLTTNCRSAELAARRDELARELETRIASERRASKDLDARWHELDRLVRQLQQQTTDCDTRRQAVEAALAETDARLRYRRFEHSAKARWPAENAAQSDNILAELDEKIARWRSALADLSARLANVRARLATIRPARGGAAATVADQQAWLSLSRQLAADLVGEVSRLARATAAQQCVCRDAHPRLRPIAETLERQLAALELLIHDARRGDEAAQLEIEIEHLVQTESGLRRHLDHLLDRRQEFTRPATSPTVHHVQLDTHDFAFSAADIQQLEERRIELEHERFRLVEQLREFKGQLRDLRAQRDTAERQRAALLSARSIEHVQRELADVQRKLEQTTADAVHAGTPILAADHPLRASDYLAQLTNGRLVRLSLVDNGQRARVADRAGESRPVEALSAVERDQVYLSLCLALLSGAATQGVHLPLVLDDPFLRLDAHATASLSAVLDGFCRQGNQVIVLTAQQTAVERLLSLGVKVQDMAGLRKRDLETAVGGIQVPPSTAPVLSPTASSPKVRSRTESPKRKKAAPHRTSNGKATKSDRSDAA